MERWLLSISQLRLPARQPSTAATNGGSSRHSAAGYGYGPFGELLRASNANPPVRQSLGGGGFRFSTKYQDDDSDVIYYGYRHYNTKMGRWLSRDPIGENGGPNYYAFIHGDGIDLIDSNGLKPGEGKYSECSYCRLSEWMRLKIRVNLLSGSMADGGTVSRHFLFANLILQQCCIDIKPHSYQTWDEAKTKAAIGWDYAVDIFNNPQSEKDMLRTTKEEDNLTKAQSANTQELFAYYVKRIDHPGEPSPLGKSYWFSAYSSPPAPAVLIAHSAANSTLAHEIGHILLDTGVHVRNDASNLMAPGGGNGANNLTESQCDKMRKAFLLRRVADQ